jgi:dUTP pyrophosphatase
MSKVILCSFYPHAIVPKRMSSGAAGYDLHSSVRDDIVIESGNQTMIDTGVGIVIPDGYYGRIAPRSSLAFKHGIDVMAGVVDSDYRGELKVILRNHGREALVVRYGDRIAQILLEKIILPEIEVVHHTQEEFEKMYTTERGSGGFGSTGK